MIQNWSKSKGKSKGKGKGKGKRNCCLFANASA